MATLGTTREQRRRRLGVDCVDRIVWKNWNVAEEYSRRLTIKNVDGQAQTISYKLPERKATFLTPFPEPVTLSSGMSYELEIRFCPTDMVEIHDTIEITVKGRGSFVVCLDCLTPFAKLTVPNKQDFGFCAVDVTTEEQITIKNSGTVPVDFAWEVPAPFTLQPSFGLLQPTESTSLTVGFAPTEACAVVGRAVCKMAGIDEVIASIQLSGVGKYPAIRFAYTDGAEDGVPGEAAVGVVRPQPLDHSTAVLDFHDVLVSGCGTSAASSAFVVENPSPVPATVSLFRRDEGVSCSFHVTPSSVVIPRGGRHRFRVVFRPKHAGLVHRDVFEVRARAGNSVCVELRGNVVGPVVRTSSSSLNFGDVNLESPPTVRDLTRTIQLRNTGNGAATFQFLHTAPGAAFVVQPTRGTIAARGVARVQVTFCPTMPMNYLRRLVVLVQDAADALSIDVFGSAYNSLSRPQPFGLAEVEAFFLRQELGLGRATPDELAGLAQSVLRGVPPSTREQQHAQQIWRRVAEDVALPGVTSPASSSVERSGADDSLLLRRRTGRLPYRRVLDLIAATTCSTAALAASSSSAGPSVPFLIEAPPVLVLGVDHPSQSVTVCNTSTAAATAAWSVPADSLVAVVPEQQDVAPGGSCTFHVVYKDADRVVVGGGGQQPRMEYLECFVNYKQMRSFRLVDEHAFTPPHCFTVQCRTDLADPPSSTATGDGVALTASTVVVDSVVSFPASRLLSSSFQVVALENTGVTSVVYDVSSLMVRDVSEKVLDDVMVAMTCSAATSATVPGEWGEPAAADTTTTTTMLTVREAVQRYEGGNASSAPTFACYPPAGLLEPHQRALVLFQFRPSVLARYEAEAALQFNSTPTDTTTLRLRGEGDVPRLLWELNPAGAAGLSVGSGGPSLAVPPTPQTLFFRPTCVSGECSREVSLLNPTGLPIVYQLTPSPELLGVVRFAPAQGALQSGERQRITAFFGPEEARAYSGSVTLVMYDEGELNGKARSSLSPTTRPLSFSAGEEYGDTGGNTAATTVEYEYVQYLDVRGDGVFGAVEVEPIAVDCGEVAGLQPQTVSLTVYNSGLCEVVYEVRTMTVTSPNEWRHAAVPPRLRHHTGVLPARSHATVLVTVQPAAGLTEYIAYVMLCGRGTDIHTVASPATLEEARQHPHCTLRVRGTRPTVQVTDVRSLSLRRSHLWSQLSITQLNDHLAAPVYPTDVESNSFAFAQYIEGLTPVSMDLGMGPQGSVPMTAYCLLENAGDCPAQFQIWLPTESGVQQEHWFLEDEALQDIQYVMDRAIIEVSPRRGEIPVGGSTVLSVTYRFDLIGIHTLPMLLRINDGKKVLLVLEGRTLPRETDAVAFHHAPHYSLLPVALGDVEPPLQSIAVENPFDHEVEYHVDTDALAKLAAAHFAFPILECVNPTGVLAPRSVAQLHWYFRPLEARMYEMRVPIMTKNGESYVLTLAGAGYHPHRTAVEEVRAQLTQAFLPLPATPALRLLHSLPVTLSTDVVRIGPTPLFAVHRHLCHLHNHHPTAVYSFHWDTRPCAGDHVTVMEPDRGVLRPGETVLCRLTFYSGSTSQLLEWPVMCNITNESVLAEEQRSTRQTEETEELDKTGENGGGFDCRAATGDSLEHQTHDATVGASGHRKSTAAAASGLSRQPVTAISAESMGARGLSSRVAAARSQLKEGLLTSTNARDSAGLTTGWAEGTAAGVPTAVVWNALELLLQAHIMPVDDYERLYGTAQLERSYLPPLHEYVDPAAPVASAAPAPAATSLSAVRFVRDVADELLRTVIAQPSVKAAFSEPLVRQQAVHYEDFVAASASASSAYTKASTEATSAVTRRDTAAPPTVGGFAGNTLEMALESVMLAVVDAVTAGAS